MPRGDRNRRVGLNPDNAPEAPSPSPHAKAFALECLRLGVPSPRRPSPRRPCPGVVTSRPAPRSQFPEASATQPELRGQFPAARSRRQFPEGSAPKAVAEARGSVALEVSLSLGPGRGRGSSAVRLDPARRPGASLPGGPAQQTILGEPGDWRPSPPSACGASMRNRTLAPTRQRGNGSRVRSSIQAPRESHPHR